MNGFKLCRLIVILTTSVRIQDLESRIDNRTLSLSTVQ